MATTSKMGIPYPASTDFVKDGATDMQSLAEEVDVRTGLVKMIPTGATGGTVAANGDITIGTTQSELIVTGAFTDDFANYQILLQGGSNSSNNADLRFKLRTSGGTNSNTGYYSGLIYSTLASATPTAFNTNNGAEWPNAGACIGTAIPNMNITLLSPNQAVRTICNNYFTRADAVGTVAGWHDVATAYNSFRIAPSAGTFTGCVVRIYGYN